MVSIIFTILAQPDSYLWNFFNNQLPHFQFWTSFTSLLRTINYTILNHRDNTYVLKFGFRDYFASNYLIAAILLGLIDFTVATLTNDISSVKLIRSYLLILFLRWIFLFVSLFAHFLFNFVPHLFGLLFLFYHYSNMI